MLPSSCGSVTVHVPTSDNDIIFSISLLNNWLQYHCIGMLHLNSLQVLLQQQVVLLGRLVDHLLWRHGRWLLWVVHYDGRHGDVSVAVHLPVVHLQRQVGDFSYS